MNKLFVFGDSFSYNYKLELKNSWPKLLANKLNLELNLLSNPGASNFQIYLTVIDTLEKISKNDLVIICTSWNDRHYVPLFNYGISAADIIQKQNKNLKLNSIENFYIENFNEEKAYLFHKKIFKTLFSLLKKWDINFFYWNLMDFDLEFYENLIYTKDNSVEFFYDWFDVDESMWLESEIAGEFGDKHLGINGSKVISEYFYEKIINKQ